MEMSMAIPKCATVQKSMLEKMDEIITKLPPSDIRDTIDKNRKIKK